MNHTVQQLMQETSKSHKDANQYSQLIMQKQRVLRQTNAGEESEGTLEKYRSCGRWKGLPTTGGGEERPPPNLNLQTRGCKNSLWLFCDRAGDENLREERRLFSAHLFLQLVLIYESLTLLKLTSSI